MYISLHVPALLKCGWSQLVARGRRTLRQLFQQVERLEVSQLENRLTLCSTYISGVIYKQFICWKLRS
jgi:hypothetical protein